MGNTTGRAGKHRGWYVGENHSVASEEERGEQSNTGTCCNSQNWGAAESSFRKQGKAWELVGCVAQGAGQHRLLRMQRSASTRPPGHNVLPLASMRASLPRRHTRFLICR